MAVYFNYKKFGCKDKEKKKQLQELLKQNYHGKEVDLISKKLCRVKLSIEGELLCHEDCPFLNLKKVDKYLSKTKNKEGEN